MVYNVKKLFDVFFQLKREGYKEVEITVLEPDIEEEIPEILLFSVPSKEFDGATTDYTEIESIKDSF